MGALALTLISWIGGAGDLQADIFVLKNGESMEGSIVDATRNTVIVRREIGGMRQMPIQDIEEVRIDLVQGTPVAGQILSWVDGVHQVRSGGEVVRIRAGRILTRERAQEASRQAPRALPPPPEEEPAVETAAPEASAAENTHAGTAESAGAADRTAAESGAAESAGVEKAAAYDSPARSAAAERRADESTATAAERTAVNNSAAEGATAERAAAEDTAAAESRDEERRAAAVTAVPDVQGASRPVAVKASVDPARAGAAGLVFRIELSRPAEQTVLLIYGTVDGTAKAGQDYEPQQGVVTFAPGSRSAEVHVPLIGQQPPHGDTRFELFLTADPKVAEIVDQRITATIEGSD